VELAAVRLLVEADPDRRELFAADVDRGAGIGRLDAGQPDQDAGFSPRISNQR